MKDTIIITGTSRGIGFELAQLFANNNYFVIAISRNSQPIDDLKHPNIKSFAIDLCDEKKIELVTNFIKEQSLNIISLIHNAGKLINKPFNELSLDEFRAVYEVNVFGVVALTQKILPFMKINSHVVTISSMGGIQGSLKFPGLSAYSSSKGAVITLSELLAEEYKEKQIAFNTLALGAVQTEMLNEAFPGYVAPINPDQMAQYIYDFALRGHQFFNGKVLQVSSTTP